MVAPPPPNSRKARLFPGEDLASVARHRCRRRGEHGLRLPANAETHEDSEWLLKGIVKGSGEAMVCEAQLIGGLCDAQARGLFDAARDEDYRSIAKEARELSAKLEATATPEPGADARVQVARLRKRSAQVAAIDFFASN